MTDVKSLLCQELVELVTDYLEQALPAPDQAVCDSHLLGCEGCRHYVEQMRRTVLMLGEIIGDAVPDDAREQLLAAFRGRRAV
jgi:predicted anti-sigma-YlaC factor YlaD